MSIRVVITDDHPVVRDGLRFAIERSGKDILVVGEAANGQELLDLASHAGADVYIMDVTMPILNGIETTRELLRGNPSARVLMLSFHGSDSVVAEALKAGARGFLSKETATRCIVEAIVAVHAGRYYLSPDVTGSVMKSFLTSDSNDGSVEQPKLHAGLTPQERRVLQLLGEGHSTKEAATLLDLSVNTIHRHRTNLMAKLGIHDQANLVRYALREGIAKP